MNHLPVLLLLLPSDTFSCISNSLNHSFHALYKKAVVSSQYLLLSHDFSTIDRQSSPEKGGLSKILPWIKRPHPHAILRNNYLSRWQLPTSMGGEYKRAIFCHMISVDHTACILLYSAFSAFLLIRYAQFYLLVSATPTVPSMMM